MTTSNYSFKNSKSVNLDNATILKELRESTLFDTDTLIQYRSLLKDDDGDDSLQTLIIDSKELLDVFVSLNPFDPSLLKYIKKDLIESINILLELNTKWEEVISQYKRLEKQGNLSDRSPLADDFFSVTSPKVVSALNAEVREFLTAIQMAINSILITKFNNSRLEIEELEKRISNATKDIEGKNAHADELVKKIAMLPSKQQVAGYSYMFNTDSENFKKASENWLKGIFGCLVGIILTGFVIYWISLNPTLNPKTGEVIIVTDSQLIISQISRLLIISCLFYALAICNKNYKSSKHNEILNKHRANALTSFQAFVDTDNIDDSTRNAVLLEATKTIYGVQQTGYVQTENDDPTTKIVELVKGVQGK